MNRFIESLLKFTSLTTLLFVIAGNLYIYTYYDNFAINIYDYLTPSEVIGIFLSNLIDFSIIAFALAVLFGALYFIAKSNMNRRLRKINTNFGRVRFKYNWHKNLLMWIILISMLAVSFIQPMFKFSGLPTKGFYVFLFVSSSLNWIIWVLLLGIVTFHFWRKFSSRNIYMVIGIAFVILLLLLSRNFGDLQSHLKMIKSDEIVSYKFDFGRNKIMTNDTLKYIGSTKDYIFFCNQIAGNLRTGVNFSTLIFKKSDLASPAVLEYKSFMLPR